MSETIVVECRQLNDNTKVMANGDYITNTESISIQDGDSIIIRNSFIDSIPVSNQFINLTEDYSITADFFYYNYTWGWTGVATHGHFAFDGTVPDPLPNGIPRGQSNNGLTNNFPAVLCELKQSSLDDTYQKYTGITFFRNKILPGSWGNIPFIIEYYDFEIQKRSYHGVIPILPNKDPKSGFQFTVPINFIGYGKTTAYPPTIIIDPDDVVTGQIDPQYNDLNFLEAANMNGVYYYQPILGTKTVTIPKGKYTPVEMGQLISKLFQTVERTDPFDIDVVSNSLLITSGTNTPAHQFVTNTSNEIYFNYMRPGGFPNVFNQPADGKNLYVPIYNYNLAGNKQVFWTGTSQFDLQFNEDTSKFFFEYLHTPFYAAAAAGVDSPEVIQVVAGLHIPGKNPIIDPPKYSFRQAYYFSKANGGIVFNSLRSTPNKFWDDILGFDLNSICVSPEYFTLDSTITGNPDDFLLQQQPTFLPFLDLVEGKTITAPFLINDMAILKNTNFQMQQLATTNEKFNIVGINSIVAPNVLLNKINTNAYYLVEVESKFKNNLFTSDNGNMKNVMAIANTYFNSNNYTSSSSADSIIYTHSGEPQILQSFGIRILDSTKKLAQDLGPDNSIFIEIVRALKMTQELTPATTKLLKNQKKAEEGKMEHRET